MHNREFPAAKNARCIFINAQQPLGKLPPRESIHGRAVERDPIFGRNPLPRHCASICTDSPRGYPRDEESYEEEREMAGGIIARVHSAQRVQRTRPRNSICLMKEPLSGKQAHCGITWNRAYGYI